MKKSNISQDDAEAIMITLDQVSQTIDVMNSVVARLKHRMGRSLSRHPRPERRESTNPDNTGTLKTLKNDSIH